MDQEKHVRILTILYDGKIKQHEVPLFRGAVIHSIGDVSDVLYHNHSADNKLRYSYPLIQYKIIQQKASIVCLNEGIDLISNDFRENGLNLRLGSRYVKFSIEDMEFCEGKLKTDDEQFRYRIFGWLPFNSKTYQTYNSLNGLIEKIQLLEHILVGNILSFAKGVGANIDDELRVKMTDLSSPYRVRHKGVQLMSFDAEFETNMFLPDHIGLGSNVSVGFGVLQFIPELK